MLRAARIAVAIACSMAAVTVVHAQASSDDRARQHFEAGRSYYDTGDYELALREFNRAYELSGRAQLYYNIALTYERLADLPRAIDTLQRYLAEASDIPNRRTLELKLVNLRKRQDEQQAAPPPPADATASQTPPPPPGPSVDAKPPAEEPAPAPPQPATTPKPSTQSAPPVADSAATVAPSDDETLPTGGDDGGMGGGAVASFVIAGVGLATFGTFAALVMMEQSDLDTRCGAAGSRCTDDDVSTLKTFALVADIGLGVAIGAGALGLVLALSSGEDGEDEAAVSVAPWLTDNGLGAATQVRF